MHSITVTSSDVAPNVNGSYLGDDGNLRTVKTEAVVKNGIAETEPTYFDSCDAGDLQTTDWVLLASTVENVDRVMNSFNECNPPSLEARWTLLKALRRIQQAAEDLEVHIAHNGLWLSRDEFDECEMFDKPLLWIDEDRKRG